MPEGKRYNAGTIFLQVVPVFGDVMNAIQRQAKDIDRALGDQLESSGEKAGERAGEGIAKGVKKSSKKAGEDAVEQFEKAWTDGIKKVQREVSTIKVGVERNEVRRDIAAIRSELDELGSKKIGLDLDPKEAYKRAAELERTLDDLKKRGTIRMGVNLDEAQKGLTSFLNRIEKARPDIVPQIDTKTVTRQMGAFEKTLRASARKAAESIDSEVGGALGDVRARLAALGDINITPELDGTQVRTEVAQISALLKKMATGENEIDIVADAGAAYESMVRVNALASELDGKNVDVGIKLDAKPAEREMGAFETKVRTSAAKAAAALAGSMDPAVRRVRDRLKEISDADLTPEVNGAAAMAEMRALVASLKQTAESADPEVRVDSSAAVVELTGLMALFSLIDGRDIEVDVDVDAGAAVAQLGILGAMMNRTGGMANRLGISGDNAANSFRSFNFVVLAAVTLLPALIPILAAVGGGLLALLPILAAVGAGIGTMIVGFTGIGDAVGALGDVQDNAAKDSVAAGKKMVGAARSVADAERALASARRSAAQSTADAERSLEDARRNAARGAADARRAVADAERSAAQAVQSALAQQRDAERALSDAQRDAAEAQRNLTEARREAREEIEQAADNRRANDLAIRQAQLDLFRAESEYNAITSDGGSTNVEREQASINLGNARLRLKELRDEQEELTKEKRKYDREGVDGTDTVQSAQDALTAALERQREAQIRVGEAAQAVNQARAAGARQVAEAVRNQQRVEADGARAIADATRNLRQAEVDGARGVADAQRNLQRAQADYQTALQETAEIGSESMQKLEEAMGKLGPAGRRFARWLFSMRDDFYRWRASIQEAMLPGIQAGLQSLIDAYGPQFRSFSVRMAEEIGRLSEAGGRNASKGPFREFFNVFTRISPKLFREFAQTSGNWMGVFARLLTIAAPYAERFSAALLVMSERALNFVQSARGTESWESFLEYAFKVGPDVVGFFGDLWHAVKNLVKALAPWGEAIMAIVGGALQFIGAMDPQTLGIIVTAILVIVTAFQLASGAVALVAGGLAVLGSAFAATILIIGLVVGAIVLAYVYFEDFRNIVNTVAAELWEGMKWYWENVGKPVWEALIATVEWAWKYVWKPYLTLMWEFWKAVFKGLKWTWENVLKPTIDAVAAAVTWLWKNILKPVLQLVWDFWTTVFKGMRWVWNNILWPVFDLISTVVWELWKLSMKPAFKLIEEGWELLSKGMRWVWNNILKPVFNFIIEEVLPRLVNAFVWAVDRIGDIWSGIQKLIATPIRWVIDTVLNNGLIAGFNRIARFVGSDEMGEIPVPDFAKKQATSQPGGDSYNGSGNRRGLYTGGIPSAQNINVYPGYTPGRDIGYVGISGGEAIMRPEFTRGAGREWVDYWNAVARAEGVGGVKKRMAVQRYGEYAGGFARGGVAGVWHPGPRSTRPGHGKSLAQAWDINSPGGEGTPVRAFLDGIITTVANLGNSSYGRYIKMNHPEAGLQSLYAHLSAQLVRVGQQVRRGQIIGREGNTGNSFGAHLHFELGGGASAIAAAGAGGGGGGGFSLPGWLGDIMKKPLMWVKDKITDAAGNISDRFGPFGTLLKDVTLKLASPVADKIRDIVGRFSPDNIKNVIDVAVNGPTKTIVQAVARRFGWGSGAQWAALVDLVQRESSWDPNAANSSSSARGLFQKMTSIHGPLEDTVAGQANWGLNYIRNRYGSPIAAIRHHDARGWYSEGGVVPDTYASSKEAGTGSLADNGTMAYDSGGYLQPGLTTVVNLTGKPEPVFTAEQFDRMESGRGGGFHYEPHFTESDLTADDVSADLIFTMKSQEHSGKYGRPGS